MEEDNNYISFFYEKIGDFVYYIKTFFYKNHELNNLYEDKYISFNKIDDVEVDNLINEMKNEIKFDKEFVELEYRYKKLVKEIDELEVKKKLDKEEYSDEEEDEEDDNDNKPNSGELIAVML